MVHETHKELKIHPKYVIDSKMIKEAIELESTAKGTWNFKDDIHEEGQALTIIKWQIKHNRITN